MRIQKCSYNYYINMPLKTKEDEKRVKLDDNDKYHIFTENMKHCEEGTPVRDEYLSKGVLL